MNIILVGFMASGKTTIGSLLASHFNFEFIDTDDLIVAKAGKSIPRIFEEDGEEHFREIEAVVLKSLSELENKIIATGGGVVLKPENREALKLAGKVVFLNVTPDQVIERVKDHKKRPLLNYEDKDKRLGKAKEILDNRMSLYKEVADYEVDTITGDPKKVADQIIEVLRS